MSRLKRKVQQLLPDRVYRVYRKRKVTREVSKYKPRS